VLDVIGEMFAAAGSPADKASKLAALDMLVARHRRDLVIQSSTAGNALEALTSFASSVNARHPADRAALQDRLTAVVGHRFENIAEMRGFAGTINNLLTAFDAELVGPGGISAALFADPKQPSFRFRPRKGSPVGRFRSVPPLVVRARTSEEA
jgi:hypothetical protein